MSIRFKHQDLPNFIKGTVRPPVLPEISQTLITVPGRAGSLDFGNSIDNRMIEFEYWIDYENKADLQEKIRQFSDWLYSENAEPLELDRDPGKTYFAKITGDVSLSEATHGGKGSITFLCCDPYVYGQEQSLNLSSTTIVTNNGSADACPALEFTFNQSTTVFSVQTENDTMILGKPQQLGDTTPQPQQVLIVGDQLDTTNGWTSGIAVDGGVIAGSMVSQGGQFRAADLGSGSKWHGPALTKGLPKQVQDFTFEMFISFASSNINQVGRIEAYLFDANSVCFAKIDFTDSKPNLSDPAFHVRAGDSSKAAFADSSREVKSGSYSQFYGRLTVQRIGNRWWAEIAKRDPVKNTYFGRWSKPFVDKDNKFMNKVASIQLHIGGYATNPINSTCGIESIYFYEENYVDPATQVPIIFVAGDKLVIDSNKGIVMKNDDPCFELLDPFSTFPVLKKGENTVTISPPVVSDATIKYQERWLT